MKLRLSQHHFADLVSPSGYFETWPYRAICTMYELIDEHEESTGVEWNFDLAMLSGVFHLSTVADYVEEYLADDCEGYDPSADFHEQLDWLREQTGLRIEDADSYGKNGTPLFIYMGE